MSTHPPGHAGSRRVTSSCPRGGSLDGIRADGWSERDRKTHRCVATLARSEHPGALRDQQLRHGQHRVEVQLWVGSSCATKGWARGKPKAIEDLGDRRLLRDRGDEPKCSAAPRAFGPYVEHSAKKSSPVHIRTRGRDAPSPRRARSERPSLLPLAPHCHAVRGELPRVRAGRRPLERGSDEEVRLAAWTVDPGGMCPGLGLGWLIVRPGARGSGSGRRWRHRGRRRQRRLVPCGLRLPRGVLRRAAVRRSDGGCDRGVYTEMFDLSGNVGEWEDSCNGCRSREFSDGCTHAHGPTARRCRAQRSTRQCRVATATERYRCDSLPWRTAPPVPATRVSLPNSLGSWPVWATGRRLAAITTRETEP
jgi:hypothetical protein